MCLLCRPPSGSSSTHPNLFECLIGLVTSHSCNVEVCSNIAMVTELWCSSTDPSLVFPSFPSPFSPVPSSFSLPPSPHSPTVNPIPPPKIQSFRCSPLAFIFCVAFSKSCSTVRPRFPNYTRFLHTIHPALLALRFLLSFHVRWGTFRNSRILQVQPWTS